VTAPTRRARRKLNQKPGERRRASRGDAPIAWRSELLGRSGVPAKVGTASSRSPPGRVPPPRVPDATARPGSMVAISNSGSARRAAVERPLVTLPAMRSKVESAACRPRRCAPAVDAQIDSSVTPATPLRAYCPGRLQSVSMMRSTSSVIRLSVKSKHCRASHRRTHQQGVAPDKRKAVVLNSCAHGTVVAAQNVAAATHGVDSGIRAAIDRLRGADCTSMRLPGIECRSRRLPAQVGVTTWPARR